MRSDIILKHAFAHSYIRPRLFCASARPCSASGRHSFIAVAKPPSIHGSNNTITSGLTKHWTWNRQLQKLYRKMVHNLEAGQVVLRLSPALKVAIWVAVRTKSIIRRKHHLNMAQTSAKPENYLCRPFLWLVAGRQCLHSACYLGVTGKHPPNLTLDA